MVMNIYIWDEVNHMSDRYHDNGAVTIISTDLESARQLWSNQKIPPKPSYDYFDHMKCDLLTSEPDYVYGLVDDTVEPLIITHQNAGCC